MPTKKYRVTLKGHNTLQNKFNGQEEAKQIKKLSDAEQAEYSAHINEEGHICIPSNWLRGCLIEYYVDNAANKTKGKTKKLVSPRIRFTPALNSTGLTTYEIDKQSITDPTGRSRDWCVRALIPEWTITTTLVTSLDKMEKELLRDLTNAGEDIGVGSARIHGYGRFTVEEFSPIT